MKIKWTETTTTKRDLWETKDFFVGKFTAENSSAAATAGGGGGTEVLGPKKECWEDRWFCGKYVVDNPQGVFTPGYCVLPPQTHVPLPTGWPTPPLPDNKMECEHLGGTWTPPTPIIWQYNAEFDGKLFQDCMCIEEGGSVPPPGRESNMTIDIEWDPPGLDQSNIPQRITGAIQMHLPGYPKKITDCWEIREVPPYVDDQKNCNCYRWKDFNFLWIISIPKQEGFDSGSKNTASDIMQNATYRQGLEGLAETLEEKGLGQGTNFMGCDCNAINDDEVTEQRGCKHGDLF